MGNAQSEEAIFNKNYSFLIGPLPNGKRVEGKLYGLSRRFLEWNSFTREDVPNDQQNTGICVLTEARSIVNPIETGASENNEISEKNIKLKLNADTSDCDLFVPLQFTRPLYTAQTYVQWKAAYDVGKLPLICRKERRTIYIQPIDSFPNFILNFSLNYNSELSNFFNLLSNFCRVFFCGVDVAVLPKIELKDQSWSIKERHHTITRKKQLLVTDFETTLPSLLPSDGLCILGIIWTDLYPSDDLNFVLGQAFFNHKCGIFCFGRFEPKTFNETNSKDISEVDSNLLWKMFKVISHETCHLFGLSHCEFFSCLMNESSSVEMALSQPMFLCPVCLRKLQNVCHFNICTRYKQLKELLKQIHSQFPHERFGESIAWLEKCLNFLNDEK